MQVPIFKYLECVDNDHPEAARIQEQFLSDIFVLFEYKTYTPGEVLVNYSDPADRLLVIVSGTLSVEFDHPEVPREGTCLNAGEYIGDLAILGDGK